MANAKEQLVIVDTVQTAGCISYFRCASETDLTKLAAAWEAQGLDMKALPAQPDKEVALGRAVRGVSEKRVLVRPLARRGAWGIVHEHAEERQGLPPKLTHEMIVHVFFRDNMPVVEQANGTYAQMQAYSERIAVAYSDARNMLAHVDVSSWLVKQAYQRNAVSLRESGGVYFIPRAKAEEWQKIAKALDAAGSSVFTIPAMRTAEAVAAITDAITAEAAAETAKIEAELEKSGDEALGARALKTRVEALEAMLTKVGTYEELIGKQLAIRERVTSLRANVSAAILTVMNEEAA